MSETYGQERLRASPLSAVLDSEDFKTIMRRYTEMKNGSIATNSETERSKDEFLTSSERLNTSEANASGT